jgi:hypothetical protein
MTEADWKDIAIIGRTSEKEIDERVEVEWKLSAKPKLEWAEIFQRADLSEGPGVLFDSVRWFVPAREIESADAEVRHRLNMANGGFRMYRSE